MYARVLIDGRSYDKAELEAVLTVMIPDRYPDEWNTFYRAWAALDRREKSRK